MDGMTRIPAAELGGLRGSIIRRMTRRMLGEVPEAVGVMGQHPRVFKDFMGVGRRSERWDELDATLSTLAVMSAAATVGCHACLDLNYFMAHRRGLDEAKIREVPRWRESDAFTPRERRVLEYAAAASQTPPVVTDELSDALLAELGPPAIVELAAKVALMNATARMNRALGVRSQHFAESCGLPPLNKPAGDVASAA